MNIQNFHDFILKRLILVDYTTLTVVPFPEARLLRKISLTLDLVKQNSFVFFLHVYEKRMLQGFIFYEGSLFLAEHMEVEIYRAARSYYTETLAETIE